VPARFMLIVKHLGFDFKSRHVMHNDEHHADQGGSRGKGRCQEMRAHQRVVPEGPGRQSLVKKGGDQVDAEGPEDGEKDKGPILNCTR